MTEGLRNVSFRKWRRETNTEKNDGKVLKSKGAPTVVVLLLLMMMAINVVTD